MHNTIVVQGTCTTIVVYVSFTTVWSMSHGQQLLCMSHAPHCCAWDMHNNYGNCKNGNHSFELDPLVKTAMPTNMCYVLIMIFVEKRKKLWTGKITFVVKN